MAQTRDRRSVSNGRRAVQNFDRHDCRVFRRGQHFPAQRYTVQAAIADDRAGLRIAQQPDRVIKIDGAAVQRR